MCVACTTTANGGSAGCSVCTSSGNTIRCSACADGYYMITGICYPCTGSFANSALCTNEAVIQCQDDFVSTLSSRYYKIGNVCVANSNNCKKMSDRTGKC